MSGDEEPDPADLEEAAAQPPKPPQPIETRPLFGCGCVTGEDWWERERERPRR